MKVIGPFNSVREKLNSFSSKTHILLVSSLRFSALCRFIVLQYWNAYSIMLRGTDRQTNWLTFKQKLELTRFLLKCEAAGKNFLRRLLRRGSPWRVFMSLNMNNTLGTTDETPTRPLLPISWPHAWATAWSTVTTDERPHFSKVLCVCLCVSVGR